jgi:hypothetical protein
MLRRSLLLVLVFSILGVVPSARSVAGTYSIDFHAITAGGTPLRGHCVLLNGSVAEVVPGYSSGGIYSVSSGFQFPLPQNASTGDEIFFTGFEGCEQ